MRVKVAVGQDPGKVGEREDVGGEMGVWSWVSLKLLISSLHWMK